MKKATSSLVVILLTVFSCVLNPPILQAQTRIPPYHQRADFLFAPPGALGNGLLGYVNPAVLNYLHGPEIRFHWSDQQATFSSPKRWGLFAGVPHLGFRIVHQKLLVPDGTTMVRGPGVTDYGVALSGGEEQLSLGLSYGWSSENLESAPRAKILTIGLLSRPSRFASIGVSAAVSLESRDREGIIGLAVRPFGTPVLTFFGDAALQRERIKDAPWSIGGVVEPVPGVRFAARYFDTKAFTAGVNLSFGAIGLWGQSHFDDNQKQSYNTYAARVGFKDHNVFDRYLKRSKYYLSTHLKGRITYQKYRLFDKGTHTLTDILFSLRSAAEDPRVAGVALNLSGMSVSRELAWEIREELIRVQQAGKHVVIFLDRGGMTKYHLASVADRIVMDPEGMLFLPGYVTGRTYFRGTLEKLGLGFDEWRFFKYKSAAERLSRDRMSDADREQSQALIDDLYTTVRNDIRESRNMPSERFDQLVNQHVAFMADSALAAGLVDTLGRWEGVKETIKNLEGSNKKMMGAAGLADRVFPRRDWGPRPQVAIVYAIGVCDMDRGINARRLEKIFQNLREDNDVKAVVFRVDSPGGDGMASDVAASALRKCAQRKPVIVSQGGIAASGGYWLSMYADTIVAAPITVTGSIGVVGGWLWNQGLGEKLGATSDHVKVGEHADLGFGITLPLIGLQIPDRNLTPEERSQVESYIRSFYDIFVEKVSESRGVDREAVERVAQGRVWSGKNAKEIGLVDVIGGLQTAISLARHAAGIPDESDVEIIELPKKGLFPLGLFRPKLPLAEPEPSADWQYLKLISEHPGEPLLVVPPDLYPPE